MLTPRAFEHSGRGRISRFFVFFEILPTHPAILFINEVGGWAPIEFQDFENFKISDYFEMFAVLGSFGASGVSQHDNGSRCIWREKMMRKNGETRNVE